jgi:hypothetical protein
VWAELDSVNAWINDKLFDSHGYVRPSGFTSSVVLCETFRSPPEFVQTLLDGQAEAAPYRRLMRALQQPSQDESLFWFWGLDPDNCFSLLSGVQQYDPKQPLDDRLTDFAETESIQGGRVWLGLVGGSRRWLLFHEFSPCNELVISIHGPQELCPSVASAFGRLAESGLAPYWATCHSTARVRFERSWRTDTVAMLARLMAQSGDFSAMPILADALQDAGCDTPDILDHCRGPVPHVHGCWVVDLVLGKE